MNAVGNLKNLAGSADYRKLIGASGMFFSKFPTHDLASSFESAVFKQGLSDPLLVPT